MCQCSTYKAPSTASRVRYGAGGCCLPSCVLFHVVLTHGPATSVASSHHLARPCLTSFERTVAAMQTLPVRCSEHRLAASKSHHHGPRATHVSVLRRRPTVIKAALGMLQGAGSHSSQGLPELVPTCSSSICLVCAALVVLGNGIAQPAAASQSPASQADSSIQKHAGLIAKLKALTGSSHQASGRWQ